MPMIEIKTALKIPDGLAEKLTKTTVDVVKCPVPMRILYGKKSIVGRLTGSV